MVFVRLVPMPNKCKAMVIQDDDDYNIYINDKRNYEQQQEAYRHEMDHIENNDFGKSVNEAEFKEVWYEKHSRSCPVLAMPYPWRNYGVADIGQIQS